MVLNHSHIQCFGVGGWNVAVSWRAEGGHATTEQNIDDDDGEDESEKEKVVKTRRKCVGHSPGVLTFYLIELIR
jgi:hypothetical protein